MFRINLNHLVDSSDDEYLDSDEELLNFLQDSASETTSESGSGSEWETASDPDDEDASEDPTRPPTASDWSNTIRTAKVCAFKLQPGLKVTPEGKSPEDFFNLLFTPPLFEFLVKNINNSARQILNKRGHSCSHSNKEVTLDEFDTFLGLLLYSGTVNTASVEDRWKGEELFNVSELHKYMPRERWSFMLKCLNFEDKTPGNIGRMSKVSYMINYFNNVMKKVIVPEKILCIDLSSVNANLLRTMFQERLFLLADRSGLVHNLQVYRGMREVIVKFDIDNVVKQLLEDRLDVGHSVYMDDFFTSLKLTKFLVSRNTHVTGPLDRDRKGNPLEVTGERLEKDRKITKYSPEGISVTKWRFRHKLLMISTEHSGEWQKHVDKRKGCIRAPVCAVEYEKNYRGVEKHDEMMSLYNCEDVARLWHKRVGVRILQMLLLNAHIMHNRYGHKPMLLENFRKAVIKHLLTRGKKTASCC